jgi:methylmalonyl-CoA mutase cobalamin-binding domain/chain
MSIDTERWHAYQQVLKAAIEAGAAAAGTALARQALEAGATPVEFFLEVIQPVLYAIGEAFARLEIFLTELMKAGLVVKAMHEQVLEPVLLATSGTAAAKAGVVVVGTCQGDIHDIGKNMVALMLQVNGFDVVNLGTNVSPRQIIEAARQKRADIIALSSLLTPSMPYMRDVIELLKGWGLREQFRVVVGGAPITEKYARHIGADGFGADAVRAVNVCRELMALKRAGAGLPSLSAQEIVA